MHFIPYGKQSIGTDDIEAVAETLKSDFLTTGPKVAEFEKAVADYCGAKYAVAVCNGTAALHIASLALLKPGEKVLTTPNSFLATSNAIIYAGAKPVFVDIQPNGNIDLDLCEESLRKDSTIKALYAVHFSGNPVEQEKLASLKEKYGVTILEDCAHSIGAVYKGIKAGSCTNSDASVFSFHPVKHMTTGEGGAVTTNNEELYERLKILRNHGMVKTPDMLPWEYEMRELGFNYRITDIQCALGLSQLKKLDGFIQRRRELARRYDEVFADHPNIEPLYSYTSRSSYHLYVVLIDFDKTAVTKEELFIRMRDRGIGLQLHYMPINRQPYYRKLGYGDESMPIMESYYDRCLSLPLYPTLENGEQDYVIETLQELIGG
ncbi:bacillosamine/legionaminic acid biosynthesis aminotransferase PglE [Hydrogenimonas sp.]|nr:bacillosamine/legionaminic acid biosynthesis aminotransferase PglE [Hydrogenimonas sp.]